MEKIYTKNAPDAIGPYSQAIKANGFVFTSGQIAINPATGNVDAEGIEAQTEQVCKNLKNVLEAAGSSLDNVVKTVCSRRYERLRGIQRRLRHLLHLQAGTLLCSRQNPSQERIGRSRDRSHGGQRASVTLDSARLWKAAFEEKLR